MVAIIDGRNMDQEPTPRIDSWSMNGRRWLSEFKAVEVAPNCYSPDKSIFRVNQIAGYFHYNLRGHITPPKSVSVFGPEQPPL